ncbi:MAG: hypothetical protein AB7I27_13330 [Bacteriovoracaceae bacterium]
MKLFFLSLVISNVAFAQMTLPSVFPDMRSVNPAVIALRKSGQIKLGGQTDKIEKEQKVNTINGGSFVYTDNSDINLNNANFFRGGKGGGLTSELYVDATTGKRESTITDASQNISTFTTDVSSTYANFSFGGGNGGLRWGLGTHHVSYKSKYDFNIAVNGSSSSSSVENTITVTGVRPGIILGSPSFSLGLYFQYDTLTSKMKSDQPVTSTGTPKNIKYVGVGLGTGGVNGLLEVAVEADPFTKQEKDQATGDTPPSPMKVSLLAERRFGKLVLGYKGMYYKGNYMDYDQIIQNQLIYRNMVDDARISHIFNFAYGGDKGFSLGVSGGVSNIKNKEKSSIYSSSEKHDTTTKSVSMGARIGYVY